VPARNSPARNTFVITSVAVLTVVGFVALWKLKVLVALLFLSFMIASAMRPGVERLARHRIPRIVGVLAHYAVLAGLLAIFLWFVVPNLLHQVEHAIGNVPQTSHKLGKAARHSTGIKHDILVGLQKELKKLPRTGGIVHTAIDAGRKAVEILVGIFFVLAAAAYWIYDRERAEDLMVRLLPKTRRKTVKDLWDLVELKLGAYVRASLLLISFVATVLSFAFWAIGLPYWLLLGILAGIVEIVPVVGPLIAGVVSVGVAFTVSFEAAVLTAVAVYGLRLLQDYVIQPRVMGNTVGIAPLAVLVTVSAVGLLLGGAYVPLAVPFTAVAATLVDVILGGKQPAHEEVPTVIFDGGDLEEYQRDTEAKARRATRRRTRGRTRTKAKS
jgi:predicted PurR-regulated permease PerM